MRATAGKLTLTAKDAISVGAGATLETPGYSKSFGDTSDPYSVSAPGGDPDPDGSDREYQLGAKLHPVGGRGARVSRAL